MAVFEQILHMSAIGGVEFPVQARRIRGGRAFARRRYPGRDGQDTEDTGREPYSFSLTIPLYADVDSSHYPDVYEALRAVVDDPTTQGEVEYVDVELGPLQAKVVSWDWDQNADQRDGGTFTIELEERTHDSFLFTIAAGFPDTRALAQDFAIAIDTDLETLGFYDGFLLELDLVGLIPEIDISIGLFLAITNDFFAALDDLAMQADEIAARVDAIRSRVDVLLSFDPAKEAQGWTIYYSGVRLADTVELIGQKTAADEPRIVAYTCRTEMSAQEVSVQLYGTDARAGEIVTNNPSDEPLFYRRGTVLLVLSE